MLLIIFIFPFSSIKSQLLVKMNPSENLIKEEKIFSRKTLFISKPGKSINSSFSIKSSFNLLSFKFNSENIFKGILRTIKGFSISDFSEFNSINFFITCSSPSQRGFSSSWKYQYSGFSILINFVLNNWDIGFSLCLIIIPIFVHGFISTGNMFFPIKQFNKDDFPVEYPPNKDILIFL